MSFGSSCSFSHGVIIEVRIGLTSLAARKQFSLPFGVDVDGSSSYWLVIDRSKAWDIAEGENSVDGTVLIGVTGIC